MVSMLKAEGQVYSKNRFPGIDRLNVYCQFNIINMLCKHDGVYYFSIQAFWTTLSTLLTLESVI